MKNMADMQRMMKAAKEMQDRLQKEMEETRVEGTAGGGVIAVTLDGRKGLVAIRIDKDVVNKDDVEMLQDLIMAAFNDASAKVDETLSRKLGGLGAGLKIPGLF
jgi:nucleoid-associated protein EbfC